MKWASFDPFTIEDPYWQGKMGMPVANLEFLRALLHHSGFDEFRFFGSDVNQSENHRRRVVELAPQAQAKLRVLPQALALQSLRSDPVDVMHNGDFTYFMPYLIEWRNRVLTDRPFPITGVTHSLDDPALYGKFLHLLLARPQPYDAIICSSQCAANLLQKTFAGLRENLKQAYGADLPEPPQLVRIPLGVADREFEPGAKAEARARLGIPRDRFLLLHLARFSPRRKMDLAPFLEALAGLKARPVSAEPLPDWQLILAGAGKKADLELVQSMIARFGLEREVTTAANVSEERKRLLLQAADVFCSLVDNHQETFGLTLLEAMAHGLPIIASDFDGYKELVSHGQTGFLIPTYGSSCAEPWQSMAGLLAPSMLRFYRAQKVSFDLDAFCAAVTVLARRPHLRQAMAMRAKIRAEAYRWSAILGDYQQLWSDLAKAARASATNRPGRPAAPVPLVTPSIDREFSHFPTGVIRNASVLGLSGHALRLPQPFQSVRYEDTAILLRDDCLQAMLAAFRGGDLTVAKIRDRIATEFQLNEPEIAIHLDWLRKHGWVAVKKL